MRGDVKIGTKVYVGKREEGVHFSEESKHELELPRAAVPREGALTEKRTYAKKGRGRKWVKTQFFPS